jgi:hypothetical protein
MLRINNFFGRKNDESTHKHVELPLVVVMGLRAHLTKTTTKFVRKKLHIHEMIMCYPN